MLPFRCTCKANWVCGRASSLLTLSVLLLGLVVFLLCVCGFSFALEDSVEKVITKLNSPLDPIRCIGQSRQVADSVFSATTIPGLILPFIKNIPVTSTQSYRLYMWEKTVWGMGTGIRRENVGSAHACCKHNAVDCTVLTETEEKKEERRGRKRKIK